MIDDGIQSDLTANQARLVVRILYSYMKDLHPSAPIKKTIREIVAILRGIFDE